MCQIFRVAAPRDKLTTDSPYGTLREILFDDEALSLVQLLVVPVRPSLDSPDNSPADSTNATCEEKRGVKRSRDHNDVHTESSQSYKQIKTQDQDETVVSNTVVTIFSLPLELHRLIFSFIEDFEDVVSFGITNRQFFPISLELLELYYMSFFGQFAGKNIVCVGEYVGPNDYPPGLFSSEELESLRQMTIKLDEDGYLEDEDYYSDGEAIESEAFTLWHFTQPGVSTRLNFWRVSIDSLETDLRIKCRRRGISKDPAWIHFERQIRQPLADNDKYFPTDQPWILRNLTTKQIVRADAIALSPDHIMGPDIRDLGFGHVLLSRICWTSHIPIYPSKAGNIVRGVWAGHCFDITTLSRHEADTHGEEWKDVSDEVAREIASIWEDGFCADWRKYLIIHGH
ncbi:hypothetical protein F4680DRAFT_304118 [Xylaria scruposa]|nr:hypothetical protein F4680DRAFT_304118 [Xylaria scruposa]